MDKLTTATGKEFDCDLFLPYPQGKRLYIRVLGINIVDAVRVFSDPAETVQFWCGKEYVANHTKVVSIGPEDDGIRISLGEA